MLTIFDQYPKLARVVPYISLGSFPTPIKKLSTLGSEIGCDNLYIKDDGVSGTRYGGNKTRKLEFLLGEAKKKRAQAVLTFGYAGSNHAVATAVWANALDLHPILLLMPQPNAQYLRQNLLLGVACNAELQLHEHLFLPAVWAAIKQRAKSSSWPYIVPPGGSSPLGAIGYVNAGFELKAQIEDGVLPTPDRIYVPLGTMGTAVGLILGLRAAGLRTRVICVRVVDSIFINPLSFLSLFVLTRNYLRHLDPSFPNVCARASDIEIIDEQLGDGYAHVTHAGRRAISQMKESEGIGLERTYTGKTMAALLADAQQGNCRDEVVIFWNTYNTVNAFNTSNTPPLSDETENLNYKSLPEAFWQYFE
ncbi:MAG: pyridoxal-phosphate dependent enzyme [Myxococcota bacterium]|nr:pyridoxal-phosphate dependent enzyme [Myxococcota bacterium]